MNKLQNEWQYKSRLGRSFRTLKRVGAGKISICNTMKEFIGIYHLGMRATTTLTRNPMRVVFPLGDGVKCSNSFPIFARAK